MKYNEYIENIGAVIGCLFLIGVGLLPLATVIFLIAWTSQNW